MLTLYARREPTTDKILIKMAPDAAKKKKDVVLYKDEGGTIPVGRYPWDYSNRPTRAKKTIVHNCFTYKLIWLDDL